MSVCSTSDRHTHSISLTELADKILRYVELEILVAAGQHTVILSSHLLLYAIRRIDAEGRDLFCTREDDDAVSADALMTVGQQTNRTCSWHEACCTIEYHNLFILHQIITH